MKRWPARGSVRTKLIVMALSTTAVALFSALLAMAVYDLRTFQRTWTDDLVTQAEILATVSAPAIAFNDPKAARENLALLRIRPQILSGAIYTGNGKRFAEYQRPDAGKATFPARPGADGYEVANGQIVVVHPVLDGDERVGTVFLRAKYPLGERLLGYLAIVALVMIASLLLAALVAARLQLTLTRPILAVADVARDVIERRNFSLRARKTTEDEIGVLVDAFNAMLAEVEQRAAALEESNRSLGHEMAVRREAENALREADRRKDEFLATLAHELRNPLAPIGMGLEIIALRCGDPAAILKAREMMARQFRQMVRLVDDLLDVSRIATGKLAIRKERIELRAVVDIALETVRKLVESRQHALDVSLPSAPVILHGDATRLAQVFANLLNNAAKYTAPGGRIGLSATVEGGEVAVQVADNGVGIPAELLPRIFDLFFQADMSLERTQSGLGVGLSLARRLVAKHGGTLSASSEGQHKGSAFTVRLPLLQAATVPGDANAGTGAVTDGLRVLLVDDNVDFVTTTGELLRTLGHTVRIAHDGQEGLAAAEAFDADVAFLDIGLPRLNGYALARRLRELPSWRATLLVAVTGWGQDADRQLAQEAGFDHHLVKPIRLEQLQSILASGRRTQTGTDR